MLFLWFDYLTDISQIIDFYYRKNNHPFATEFKDRSRKILIFYSQIIEKIIGTTNISKSNVRFKSLEVINLDEEEISIRTAIAPILDSIEKFIKLFSNHIYISKIQ